MQYRTIGKRVTGEYSALGFGCMRFPMIEKEGKKEIDLAQVEKMFEKALDSGINYIDTAYPYHGGESEKIVGEYLCKKHRNRFSLASKMPVWEVKKEEDFERLFQEQLGKLQTDHIDFYLVHAIDKNGWERMKALNIQNWLLEKQKSGQIKYKGFSFHGPAEDFPHIVDAWEDEWDFCQIQYNFMDKKNQAGEAGLLHAYGKGIGVIIMEPLLGGSLSNPPKPMQDFWAKADPSISPVERAFQWLWDLKEVGVVLSGMSNMQQLEEDIDFASRSAIDSLTEEDRALYPRAEELYKTLRPVPCTACEYCLPCPSGVAIPRVFGLYNDAVGYNQNLEIRKGQYFWVPANEKAENCTECGVCLDKCPQKIDIITKLKEYREMLTA